MTLDYIHNYNAFNENIMRLYEFDKAQAIQFRDALQQTILQQKQSLDVNALPFVQARNCNLLLQLSDEDEGIIQVAKFDFNCKLTYLSYEKMIAILAPFCLKETKGYQWLYDVDNLTDFLFSPGGTW